MKLKNLVVIMCVLGFILTIGAGCGRKLPPLPPGQEDPLELRAIEFADDGTVEAKVKTGTDGARVTLLGKPKGMCPSCTDDLTKRDEKVVEKKGTVVLKDPKPESEYMVYRVSFEKGTLSFMTGPRVVKK